MKKEDISQQQFERILECFMQSMAKHGLKGTTMDSIASKLQMSKRSLYEIFGNKNEILKEAHKHYENKIGLKLQEIFISSNNVMEAIIKCFLYNRDLMSNINAEFFRDMDQFVKKHKFISESQCIHNHHNLHVVLERGVQEGYFRDDINIMVQVRMFSIQMQALKNMEELFPPDISLLEVYDNVIIGFLRAISSPKGLIELEKYLPSLSSLSNND